MGVQQPVVLAVGLYCGGCPETAGHHCCPQARVDGRLVFDNSEQPWHTTMNVSYVTGGEAINQVRENKPIQRRCSKCCLLRARGKSMRRMGWHDCCLLCEYAEYLPQQHTGFTVFAV
jgi:hypothetical protein